ncbi:MAG: hypothetical protein E6K14_03170 [Methanobacteriota archaeon]|nr:MAG: hypothetical protein E6K14_03170 [Euryarchaeota archaeon]
MRAGREEYGIRTLFVALVLALANGIVWFPVWSSGPEGTGMRILLGFVTIQPLAFILERLLPSVAIVGVLGAYLVESGRHETRGGRGGWLDRARFAFASAIVAGVALLASIVFLAGSGFSLMPFYPVAGVAITLASGLYLLWTAERMAGASARGLDVAALAIACVSAALRFTTDAPLGVAPVDLWNGIRWMDITRWLLGEISVALWIVVYSGIVLRGQVVRASVSVAGDA